MARNNLVAHQTSPGALLNLGYNPTALSRFKSEKSENEDKPAKRERPGWVDNPPEGFRVGKATSSDLQMAVNKAGNNRGGGQEKHIEAAPDGQFIAYVLMPISATEDVSDSPEEPLQDYESPDLEIDLEDLASTQYEDAEGPAVNPYSLEEEEEEEAVSTEPTLEEQIADVREPTTAPVTSRSLLDTPTARRLREKRGANIAALDERAAVGNQQQAAIAESTDYRRGGGQDINVLPSDGAEERERLVKYGKTRPEATIRPSRTAGMRAPDMQRVEQSALPGAGAAQAAQEEEQGDGLMSRLAGLGGGIGGFVKDNPDLVLQGLQTAGELGGAYKRGRREEEAAKRMAQEARMGTAISALTRGRVNPSVAPQMPRTSAGESMFDVMAGVGRGGQEFMAGKRQRADKLRAEGIEEDEIARQTARDEELMELEQYDAETRRMGVTGKIEKDRKKAEEEAAEKAKESKLKQEDADYIAGQLKRMKTLFDEGNFLTTGKSSIDQSWLPGATRQKEFDAVKGSLLGYMNQIMRLGRMSDKDVALIERQLPDRDEATAYNEGVHKGLMGNLQAITPGWTSTRFGETGSGFEGGLSAQTSRWGSTQFTDDDLLELTDDELDELSPADFEALEAEMNKRGL
jgi:hypothetical protein